jgi:glucose dehydrogenase
MTRHRKFSNCRAMLLAGTMALLCSAKAFSVDVTSGDWPEVNHDKLGTRYSPLALINTSNAKNLKKVCDYKFPVGAVTATAGDVVLTGELNGDLVALDGKSGKVLFRGDVGGPIAGGVATYVARNVQHIAVVSGYVGVFNIFAPDIGGSNPTINVFRLAK